MTGIDERQAAEIIFWRDAVHESPGADSVHNLVNKMADAQVFLECIDRHREKLALRGTVLEIGAGQGWASCIYKRLFPQASVTTTDISEFAIASLTQWERLYQVKVDRSYACKSYETREADASTDLVFCFAAAHHFLAHDETLREMSRILRPGGRIFYFYEPSSPRYLYRPTVWKMNRSRPELREDVLLPAVLRGLAERHGLVFSAHYHPSLVKRGAIEANYFMVLRALPFLQRVLPCTVNFLFEKPQR